MIPNLKRSENKPSQFKFRFYDRSLLLKTRPRFASLSSDRCKSIYFDTPPGQSLSMTQITCRPNHKWLEWKTWCMPLINCKPFACLWSRSRTCLFQSSCQTGESFNAPKRKTNQSCINSQITCDYFPATFGFRVHGHLKKSNLFGVFKLHLH